jgi:hypothetical protein
MFGILGYLDALAASTGPLFGLRRCATQESSAGRE